MDTILSIAMGLTLWAMFLLFAAIEKGWAIIVGLLAFLAPIICLLLVSYSRPKSYTRVRVRSSTPLVFPQICVISGEPSTEMHAIRSLRGGFSVLQELQISLPFSTSGWIKYTRQFPLSLKIFKTPLYTSFRIPIFFRWLVVWCWAVVGGFVCGFIAIHDLLLHRHQMIRVNRIYIKEGNIYGVDLVVPDKSFSEELEQLNKSTLIKRK
jgi:hypothetical protein